MNISDEQILATAIDKLTIAAREIAELLRQRDDAGKAASPPALMTVAEVAERLGVSRSTVRDLERRGKLTACRIGNGRGTLRFTSAALERLEKESSGSSPLTNRIRRFVR